jgi:hypothetical protein
MKSQKGAWTSEVLSTVRPKEEAKDTKVACTKNKDIHMYIYIYIHEIPKGCMDFRGSIKGETKGGRQR